MNVQSFQPENSLSKLITISAASQSVDLAVDCDQVLIANTSTAAIAVLWAASTGGVLTASFADAGGVILPAGSVSVFSKSPTANRFAVIGLAANGYCQITPGAGL
jgi:hypothetical protein